MTRALVAAALSLFATTAMTAPKPDEPQPFTARDLVMLERVSDPRVSPDGRFVAYTLRETDYAANKGIKHLWLVPTAGGEPRKLTGGAGNDNDGRWAPDSASLYFLSTRSGSSQLWRLPMAGGEAMQVTDLPLDVNAWALSPDGKRVALSMEVFADCPDLACTKKRLDERASGKASGMLFDKLFIRHWDTYSNGTRAQLFTAALGADGRAAPPVLVSRGIDGDVPGKPFGDDTDFAFSPDGKSIAFAARIAGNTEAWSTNLDIYLAPADGSAAPKNLTVTNLATDAGPLFSPDGRWLAWRAMKRAGFEADRQAIMLRDLATGATREIAPSWDRSAEGLVFTDDGKTLFTHADDLGQHRVFAVDVAGGNVRALTGDGNVSGFSLAGERVVYALNTLTAPDDLFIAGADGKATQLTHHNAARLAHIRFGEFEQFSFPGWNGDVVHGYVMKPWNYVKGKKYPIAFIIHGGPQGSMGNHWHYRWNPAAYSGMGYAVVFIDFHGSTGYGQAFTDAISNHWGDRPLEDLQKGLKHALKTYDWLDGTRAAALGASYGGYMVNWIAGNWNEAFKCLVTHDGLFDNRSSYYGTEELWFDEWERGGTPYEKPEAYELHNPVNHVAQWKLPMLVVQGEKDYRVTADQGISAFTALQRRGIPSQLLVFPDENHWVLKPQNSVLWHDTVQAWLKKWL
jgi:dipeptidyl aminopeptidase/acylaminoacyl peptidase